MSSELVSFQAYIDGEWCDAASGRRMVSVNPATEEAWCDFPDCQEEDVDRAVRAAHRAFTEGPWATTSPVERGRILKAIAAALPDHNERLARLEVSDAGKIFTESTGFQKFCADFFMFYGELADKAVGHTFSVPFPGIQSYTHRVPMGVVAAVIPWNNPLWLLSLKLGPALAAGNTIVIKTSELCSAPLLEFMKIVEEVVDIPPGVVNFVTGSGEPCGRTLTSHPLVAKIAFTGGPATARRIVANSVDNLAEISLELGGKSPALVFPDADLDNAVASLMAGVFLGSAGQSCVASSRAIVHEDIFDEFLGRFTSAASAIRIGDPMSTETQMGPLATEDQRARIQSAVDAAVTAGAELLVGGKAPDAPERGWFFEPTVLLCRDHSLPIVDTELFGPVITVTPFSTEAQAIALANDTKYGLAAGFFTRDLGTAMRLTRAVRAGIQYVNCYRLGAPMARIGGFGDSGKSREGGLDAIYEYTKPANVWINTAV